MCFVFLNLKSHCILLKWHHYHGDLKYAAGHQCRHIYKIRDLISAWNPIHTVINRLYLRHTPMFPTEGFREEPCTGWNTGKQQCYVKLLKERMFSSDHWQMGWWSPAPARLNWEHEVCSLNDLLINRMHPAVTLLFMETRRNFKNITVSIIHSRRQLKQYPLKPPNCPRDSGSEHHINLTRISLHLFLCPLALRSLPLPIDSFWMDEHILSLYQYK